MSFELGKVIADHYGPRTAESYDQLAYSHFWAYEEAMRTVAVEWVWAQAALPERGTIRLLDVGAGTGNLSATILKEAGERLKAENRQIGFDVTLFDSSSHMLERARIKLSGGLCERLALSEGRLEVGGWGEGYDLIVTSFALHHLDGEGKKDCLRRLYSALNPKGRLIVLDRMWLERPGVPAEEEAFLRVVASRFYPMVKAKHPEMTLDLLTQVIRQDFERDGDRPSRLQEHLDWMAAIGFSSVRPFYSSFGIAAVSGQRPWEN